MNVKAVGAASVRCMPRVTKYCKTFGVKVQDVPDRICERSYISHTCSPDIPWVFFSTCFYKLCVTYDDVQVLRVRG